MLTCVYFVAHYLFASVTAHTAAILPVMLADGARARLNVSTLAMMLVLSGGIMGLLAHRWRRPQPGVLRQRNLPAREVLATRCAACGCLFSQPGCGGLWLMPIGYGEKGSGIIRWRRTA